MPASAPVLIPPRPVLPPADDGLAVVRVGAAGDSVVDDEIVDPETEVVDVWVDATAVQSDGDTAANVSSVTVPLHPLSPQHCHTA